MNQENKNNSSKNVLNLQPISRNGGRLAHSKMAQFTPNEDLIQSTSRIKNQRDIILDRIDRMENSNDRVSDAVFQKVKRDYSMQLETITELLDEKKNILKEEIKKLYRIREKLTVEVNRHREILEEADFRHYLGEFTQSQYQEVENFETKEIEKAEADLSHINQWIRTHEELLDPQDFGGRPRVEPQPKPQASKSEATQTAYRPAPQKPEPEQKSAETVAAQTPSTTSTHDSEENFSHLLNDTPESSAEDNIEKALHDDTNSNLDELIQEVQKSVQEVDANDKNQTQENSPEPTTPENKSQEEQKQSPQGTSENQDYFENQTQEEASFKIRADELEKQQEKAKSSEENLPEGDSMTFAKTSVSDATPLPQKPEDEAKAPDAQKDPAKEDSISDILDSIRLEGEDDQDAEPQEKKETAKQPKTDYKLTLTQGDLDQKEYPLQTNTSIGRSPSNDVVLKEPKVSRQHAAINFYNGKYIMVDLKSSNGVFVNGSKIDETVLNAGDEVSIGGYKFIFMKND